MSTTANHSWVLLGRIVRAHGIRGELRVHADGDTLLGRPRIWLAAPRTAAPAAGATPRTIVSVRRERDALLVRLDGVDDRDQAEALRGSGVFTERALLPALPASEVYAADLVGLTVVDLAGVTLGVVTDSWPSPAHEMLVLRAPDGHELMLPFIDEVVRSLDVAARRIVCDPAPGMLDQAATGKPVDEDAE